MGKIDKIMATIGIVGLLLVGCTDEPQQKYVKTTGEVVGKHITSGRFGNSYYIEVSYPVGENKYSIDSVDVDKTAYDSYNSKDKVTVYGNDKGIGGIVK